MRTQQIPLTVVVRIQDISGGSRGTSIYFVRALGNNDKFLIKSETFITVRIG